MKNKSVFFCYVKNNKKNFLCLLIIFFIGIAVGITFINHANESQILEIQGYVTSLKDNIKSSDDINKTLLLMQSMKKNAIFVLLIWFLGCTIIGSFLIYVAVIYKGFSIGYTVSAIIATLGVKSRIYFFYLIIAFTKLDFFTNDIDSIRKWNKII